MSEQFIDFEGRVVVLTGATGGLGSDIASLLSRLNARLLLLGRDEQRLQAQIDRLQGSGHQLCAVDLSEPESLEGKLKPVLKALGGIYGLCHCAGAVAFRPLNLSKPELLQDIMRINTYAGVELARLIANRTVATAGEGSVVFVSSICADIGAAGQVAYCASKGAVNAAVRALALELAARNIKVNTVSPGVIRTEMTDVKSGLSPQQIEQMLERYPLANGRPEDIARAVAFLLAPENRWITGIDLKIDGGFSAQ